MSESNWTGEHQIDLWRITDPLDTRGLHIRNSSLPAEILALLEKINVNSVSFFLFFFFLHNWLSSPLSVLPVLKCFMRNIRLQTEKEKAMWPWRQRLQWCKPQTKESQKPQKLDEARNRFSPRGPTWFRPVKLTLDFWSLESMRDQRFALLSHQLSGNFLQQPKGTNTDFST